MCSYGLSCAHRLSPIWTFRLSAIPLKLFHVTKLSLVMVQLASHKVVVLGLPTAAAFPEQDEAATGVRAAVRSIKAASISAMSAPQSLRAAASALLSSARSPSAKGGANSPRGSSAVREASSTAADPAAGASGQATTPKKGFGFGSFLSKFRKDK